MSNKDPWRLRDYYAEKQVEKEAQARKESDPVKRAALEREAESYAREAQLKQNEATGLELNRGNTGGKGKK